MQIFALRWLRHSHLVPPPVSPSALRADVRSRDAYAAERQPRSSNVHFPRGPIHLPAGPPHHPTWHPKATQTQIGPTLCLLGLRTPEHENYGCWNEWVCTYFAPAVLQATSGTRDTKSESQTKLQVVFSECLLFPYSSACYYSNIVRPTGLVG